MLQAADDIVIELCCTHMQVGNSAEAELLIELSRKLNEGGPAGFGYLTYPQTEWTGGDSADPRNYTIREPNIVHMGKRFPREQVEADPQGPALP